MKSQTTRFLLGLSLLALSAPIYAHAYGAYVGAEATLTNWDYQLDNDIVFDSGASGHERSINFGLNDIDYSGEARLGGFIHWQGCPWITAIEVFGGPNFSKVSHNALIPAGEVTSKNGVAYGEILKQKVSTDWSYGLDLKQSYFMSEDWLLFGKVGVVRTKFDVESEFIVDNAFVSETGDSPSLTGIRLGFGVEKFFTQTLSITVQGLYTQYEHYKDDDISTAYVGTPISSANNVGEALNVTDHLEMKIHAIEFGIGFNYYFS